MSSARLARLPRKRDAFANPTMNPITPVQTDDVNALLSRIPQGQHADWDLQFPIAQDIIDAVQCCFSEQGIWPISFSYPKPPLSMAAAKTELISAIRPGAAYSFDDEDEYLRTYASAHFSVTHRKAGWDCFRHLEILAAGSLPLMVDAHDIPRHSLVHYPKAAMRGVLDHVSHSGDIAPAWVGMAFREHFTSHLTSEAMARYLLEASGLQGAERVLFVDAQLPLSPDYQSVLALIGLKQLLGANCQSMYPASYIYEGNAYSRDLYGRGFGYTSVVPMTSRSSQERQSHSRSLKRELRAGRFDAVVIGSIARNCPLALRILKDFPAEQTVWIHGEDAPPSESQMEFLRNSGPKTFVRSVPGV
ncbi:MAG: hypothetical protein Q8L05_11015 [Actinomycetota bacterium]|nr:hypothetical protein [Actinomycetota bacterium]MDP2287985.1 hypothetical protein [Actinomycetota bacterium]